MYWRRVIPIYQMEELYFYEILEDYQSADDAQKEAIFQTFCASLWANENKRKTVTKTIRFRVRKDLRSTELGKIFDTWSAVTYTSYRSMTKKTDYASLLRQKINNIYTNLFDPEVCLKQEYLKALHLPKTLYYQWVNGTYFEPDDVTIAIDDAIADSIQMKRDAAKEKMTLSWEEYQRLVETCLKGLFTRFICLDEYESKAASSTPSDLWLEDNYCVRYFCKGLEGFFRNYQKEYYGLPKSTRYCYRRCNCCHSLYEKKHNRQVYCPACAARRKKERYLTYNKKRQPQLEKSNIACI